MNKLLKKYIDTNRFGNPLHRLTTFMFFRNYDWDDFFKKADNIYYAFKKLPSNSFIELLEKAPHAEIKSFLEQNTLIYKKILIDLLNENNIAVAKYLQSKANYPYLQMKDIPDFNSQEANEEPLALAIMTKNKNFYEILASPFYDSEGKESIRKRTEILFHFIRNIDIEGVKFSLDNKIGKYYTNNPVRGKTKNTVLSEAFKNTDRDFYEKNKEKINEIFRLLYEDFTENKVDHNTYYFSNTRKSKADNDKKICINDISHNVYPEIISDILYHFSPIYKMEKNFEIESFAMKSHLVDEKAYDGYDLFDKDNSSGEEIIWAMLKMDFDSRSKNKNIKESYLMFHILCEIEKIKIDTEKKINVIKFQDLNDFINKRMYLIEKCKDTSIILNDKITVQKPDNKYISFKLNHPTLSLILNNKKYFESLFNNSRRECMDRLSTVDVYNSGAYDLLKSIQEEYADNPHKSISKVEQIRYFQNGDSGIQLLFKHDEDIMKSLKEECTKNYIKFMVEKWDSDILKQFKISNFISTNNLSFDFFEDTVKTVFAEKLESFSVRVLNNSIFSKEIEEFNYHVAEECAITSKKMLSDSVEIGKIKKTNTVRL